MRDTAQVFNKAPVEHFNEEVLYKGKLVPRTCIRCVCGKEYALVNADGRPVDSFGIGSVGSTCPRCGKQNYV